MKNIPSIKEDIQNQFKILPLDGIRVRQQAHGHDFYVVIYVKDGSGTQHIDYEQIPIVSSRVHFIAPHRVHLWDGVCTGYSMMISSSYLNDMSDVFDTLFMDFKNNIYLDIPVKMHKQFDMFIEILTSRYYAQHTSFRLMRSLVHSFLCYCYDLKQQNARQSNTKEDNRLTYTS